MGRFLGTLHKLADMAASGGSASTSSYHPSHHWAQILNYLEVHAVAHASKSNPKFDSPLPPFTSPSRELERELLDQQGPKREDTPLRIIMRANSSVTIPCSVVAALLHLCPEAAQISDSKDRIPLHWACRRSPDSSTGAGRETDKILKVLIICYPQGLLHRDDGGRTPLHWLFWYHAPSRTPKIVELFCQHLPYEAFVGIKQVPDSNLPEIPTPTSENGSKVPNNASIVHDSKHGALPLHYAVMEHASRDCLRVLLNAYPLSKTCGDGKGRTALHWYLGAGDANLHICGEPHDPNAIPWHEQPKLQSAIIHMLINSRVARSADVQKGRLPLHWACHLAARHYHSEHSHALVSGPVLSVSRNNTPRSADGGDSYFLSVKSVQVLLDHNMDALTAPDFDKRTPLHLIWDVALEQQELEWKRLVNNRITRDYLDARHGGSRAPQPPDDLECEDSWPFFAPPLDVVKLLLRIEESNTNIVRGAALSPSSAGEDPSQRPPCAAFCEDILGRLPLHGAMQVGAATALVQALIQAHPTSLLHTSSEEASQTPLHAAFLSPYITPILTRDHVSILLQAYLTSRHGTYVHGRLTLKMEDSYGKYPLHYACQNQACYDVISLLVEKYPKACLMADHRGNLPLHCLLDETDFFTLHDSDQRRGSHNDNDKEDISEMSTGSVVMSASLAATMGWMSERETKFRQDHLQVTCDKMRLLLEPLLFQAEALALPSAAHGLLPLHVAVAFDVLTYAQLQVMVATYPAACTIRTTFPGNEFTPLDLHDMRKSYVHSLQPREGDVTSDDDPFLKWHAVRELLYSVHPQMATHCRQDDLLDACVNLIRDEAQGLKSVHMREELRRMRGPVVLPIPVDAMSDIVEIPEIEHGGRPQAAKSVRSPNGNTPKFKKKRFFPSSSKPKIAKAKQRGKNGKSGQQQQQRQKKSIYDDDDVGTGYIISPENSFDVDDDDLVFSDDQSEELEIGGDSDDEEDSDDGFLEHEREVEYAPEEKKEDDALEELLEKDDFGLKREESIETPLLSQVAMKLWTFFLLYHNPESPEENYSDQVSAVFSDLDFSTVERLVSMPLPPYAKDFLTPRDCAVLDLQQQDPESADSVVTLRDMASPMAKAVIRKTYYFLGRFEWGDSNTDSNGGKGNGNSFLLHRSSDDATIILCATEYDFTTEDYKPPPDEIPGEAEAEIWETGEVPIVDKKGTRKASFRVKTRPVCIKFMRSADAYQNELQCRIDLGVPVEEGTDAFNSQVGNHFVPLLSHCTALGDRLEDRQYRRDTNDDRFKIVWIIPPNDAKGHDNKLMNQGRAISLEDYPFAVVLPFWSAKDLHDYYYHHGTSGIEEIRELGAQIGKSILSMHDKAVVHGTVTMRNVALLPSSDDTDLGFTRYCALTDLSCAHRLQISNTYMGGISRSGTAQFQSGVLPPEMFVRLSPGELKMYDEYWRMVKEKLGVHVDETVIAPHRDTVTGDSYVLRCHFNPADTITQELPQLPYQLVPARETSDLWSFGLIVFTLCSNGRPLFPTNLRSGHLLDFGQIATWNADKASTMIYEHVRDPLAQDFLLLVLSSYEARSSLNMRSLLSHPFFTKIGQITRKIQKTIDLRSSECLAHRRRTEKEVSYLSEEEWLRERTLNINCWDLNLHARIQFSSSNLIRTMLAADAAVPRIPYAFIMLPYKLARGKTGKLTPVTKLNVEQAERMGVQLLALSKACHFASLIQQAVSAAKDEAHHWSSSEISAAMALSSELFSHLEAEMTDIAAKHVELFRDDPVAVARKVVQARIKDLLACFRESGKVFFYFVDEFDCVPVVGTADNLYPVKVEQARKEEMLVRGLPFMHMTIMYARAISGSVAGLVKLIFEGAYPHIPPSWEAASRGLDHILDETALTREVTILRESLADLKQTKVSKGIDDLRFVNDFALDYDARRSFANLIRVKSGEASFWTLERGGQQLKEMSQACQFSQALESKSAMEKQIKEQAARIAYLEATLEKVEFRREHNLFLPQGL